MDTNSLSYRTAKNSTYTFFNYIFPLVFAILITPVIVHKLGVADYGVYVLVNTIMAFLGLVDLGLGMAVFRYTAQYHATEDWSTLQRMLSAANILFFIFAVFGFLIYLAAGKFGLPMFHISPSSQIHIFEVFVLAGILFFVNAVSSGIVQIPSALQRYDISVKINFFQLTIFNLLVLALVLMGYKLKAILLVNIVVAICSVAAYIWYSSRLLPNIKFGLSWDTEQIKKCYRFGVAAYVTNAANNAISKLDRLIIPAILGPSMLSYYSLPGNVGEKVNGVMSSITTALYPLSTSLQAVGETERIGSIYKKVIRTVSVLGVAMTVGIIIFADKILLYWLGHDFAKSAGVLDILAVTNLLMGFYTILMGLIMAMGRVRFLMKFSVFMAVLNVVLVLVLTPRWGITGAAWAYLITVLPVIWMCAYAEKNILKLPSQVKFYAKLLLKILLVSGVLGLLGVFVLRPLVSNIWSLIVLGPLSVLLFLLLYKVFGFMEQEDWDLVKNFAIHLKNRLC